MPVFPHNEAFQDAGNCSFKIGTKEINPFRGSDDSNLPDGKKSSNLTSKPAFFSVERVSKVSSFFYEKWKETVQHTYELRRYAIIMKIKYK